MKVSQDDEESKEGGDQSPKPVSLDEEEAEECRIVEEVQNHQTPAGVPVSAPAQIDFEEQKFGIKDAEATQLGIITFASSQLPLDSQLTAYLTELLAEPYNKWCLDCKMNLATHAIVVYGTFVCEECSKKIVVLFGRE